MPPSNWSSRTSDPTDTASSTSAVSSWGVDTDTSTPQLSLNSHWFFGWLTRATTRGTANSCLASREMTRLSSSSPVAATTTSTVARPAASSEDTSQASAGHPGRRRASARSRSTRSGSCSMSKHVVARWRGGPGRWRCRRCRRRRWRPSWRRRSRRSVPRRATPAGRTAGAVAVELVEARPASTARWRTSPSWPTRSRDVEAGRAGPGHRHQPRPRPGSSRSASRAPAQRSGSDRSTASSGPVASAHSAVGRVGQEPAPHLVDGPGHGGHGGDAQALVDLGPAGVVDAGHHVGDLVGLAGDPHGEDVGVVAAGHRGQGVGPAAPARSRSSRSNPEPTIALALPLGRAAAGRPVATRSMMATECPSSVRAMARPGTDPAASDHDDVHPDSATRTAAG